jgi:beta-lactamase superfamily II metal-dependent hydrolase
MKIEIHDVDHGGCVVVSGPAGHRLMLDCGLSLNRPWFPSISYFGHRIDTLMLLNLDEDHCEDLDFLWKNCPIGAIVSNPTIDSRALRAMKREGGMRSGVKKVAEILDYFGPGFCGDWSNDLGGVQWHAFWNRYGQDFDDTNNLSLAVFVRFAGFTILFGGDLECAGWKRLLTLPQFRERLAETTVFVASHHGRENGCCEELFDWCRPEIIVFSDGYKQYSTQETHGWYSRRARGIPDFSKPQGIFGQPQRRVVTTRCDGTITIDVDATGRYIINTSRTSGSPTPFSLPNVDHIPSRELLGIAPLLASKTF